MSDSAQNVEIEDVLSSIRRLVSGDDWTRVVGADGADTPSLPRVEPAKVTSDTSVAPEKFVLTPVLRVVAAPDKTETTEAAEEATAPDAQGVEPESAARPEIRDEASPESVEPLEAAPARDAEPEMREEPAETVQTEDNGADTLSTQAEALEDHAVSAEEAEQASHLDQANSEPESTPPADTAPQATSVSDGRIPIEATIAELEAAVGGQADDWEPDGSETSAAPDPEWTAPTARRTVAADPDAIEDAQEVDDYDADEEITFHHVGPDFVSAEHLEDLAAGLAAGAAAAGAGAATYGAQLDDNLNSYLDSDSVIDEQALRDLVAEIVRQELQGALGERITRNVRKLVRREIYRVLASQEFE